MQEYGVLVYLMMLSGLNTIFPISFPYFGIIESSNHPKKGEEKKMSNSTVNGQEPAPFENRWKHMCL